MKQLQNILMENGFRFESKTAWYGRRTRSICFSRFKDDTTIVGVVDFNRSKDTASFKLNVGIADKMESLLLDNLSASNAITRIVEVIEANGLPV